MVWWDYTPAYPLVISCSLRSGKNTCDENNLCWSLLLSGCGKIADERNRTNHSCCKPLRESYILAWSSHTFDIDIYLQKPWNRKQHIKTCVYIYIYMYIHYITLLYITYHYIALHYITLHYIHTFRYRYNLSKAMPSNSPRRRRPWDPPEHLPPPLRSNPRSDCPTNASAEPPSCAVGDGTLW